MTSVKNARLAAAILLEMWEFHLRRQSIVQPRKSVSIDGGISMPFIVMLRWDQSNSFLHMIMNTV